MGEEVVVARDGEGSGHDRHPQVAHFGGGRGLPHHRVAIGDEDRGAGRGVGDLSRDRHRRVDGTALVVTHPVADREAGLRCACPSRAGPTQGRGQRPADEDSSRAGTMARVPHHRRASSLRRSAVRSKNPGKRRFTRVREGGYARQARGTRPVHGPHRSFAEPLTLSVRSGMIARFLDGGEQYPASLGRWPCAFARFFS